MRRLQRPAARGCAHTRGYTALPPLRCTAHSRLRTRWIVTDSRYAHARGIARMRGSTCHARRTYLFMRFAHARTCGYWMLRSATHAQFCSLRTVLQLPHLLHCYGCACTTARFTRTALGLPHLHTIPRLYLPTGWQFTAILPAAPGLHYLDVEMIFARTSAVEILHSCARVLRGSRARALLRTATRSAGLPALPHTRRCLRFHTAPASLPRTHGFCCLGCALHTRAPHCVTAARMRAADLARIARFYAVAPLSRTALRRDYALGAFRFALFASFTHATAAQWVTPRCLDCGSRSVADTATTYAPHRAFTAWVVTAHAHVYALLHTAAAHLRTFARSRLRLRRTRCTLLHRTARTAPAAHCAQLPRGSPGFFSARTVASTARGGIAVLRAPRTPRAHACRGCRVSRFALRHIAAIDEDHSAHAARCASFVHR